MIYHNYSYLAKPFGLLDASIASSITDRKHHPLLKGVEVLPVWTNCSDFLISIKKSLLEDERLAIPLHFIDFMLKKFSL